MKYFKKAFDPINLQHAKDIVLTPNEYQPDKFDEETDFMIAFLRDRALLDSDSRVLDFGCGMGRLSKKLIEAFGCYVVGVDMSLNMLLLAAKYVNDQERFEPRGQCNARGIDAALSVFVLQHAEDPATELQRIASALKPGGYLVMVEGPRLVPVGADAQGYVIWHDDGLVIGDLAAKYFKNIGWYDYPHREGKKILSLWQRKEA